MIDRLERRAGSALVWQGIQHFGVKAIYLVRIPILARLLLPEDFGLLAIAIVALDVLLQVTNFGVIPALVQREAVDREHYHAAWTVGVLRALAVAIIVFLGAPIIAGVFGEPRALPVIRLLALRPLIQAVASIGIADLTRDLRFRGIAVLNLSEALANATISIALAPSLGVWALVAGFLAGPACYAAMSYVLAPRRPRFAIDRTATSSLIAFGRWIFLVGIIALAGRFVLQAVISRRLGATELGLYYLAAKIAYLPTEIAADLIGGVAFPLYARLQADAQRAVRAFRVILVAPAALLVPAQALLIVLASSLVSELLGARWIGTAPIIQVLAIASLIGLLADAAHPIFNGLGQPQKVVAFEGVQYALLIGLVWELTGRFGLVGAVSAWLPATIAAQIVAVVLLRSVLPRPFEGTLAPLLAIAAISAVGGAIAFALDRVVGGLLGFVLAGLFGAATMGILLWVNDRRYGLGLRSLLGRIFPRLATFVGA